MYVYVGERRVAQAVVHAAGGRARLHAAQLAQAARAAAALLHLARALHIG